MPEIRTWTHPDGTVYNFGLSAYPVGSIYAGEFGQDPETLFGGTWATLGCITGYETETIEIELPSVSGGGILASVYDLTTSSFYTEWDPVGIVGFGVIGTSALSVNRVMVDEADAEVSYLLRNNTSTATPAHTAQNPKTFNFTVLWKSTTEPCFWVRTA